MKGLAQLLVAQKVNAFRKENNSSVATKAEASFPLALCKFSIRL
jgi:hypothetical protein